MLAASSVWYLGFLGNLLGIVLATCLVSTLAVGCGRLLLRHHSATRHSVLLAGLFWLFVLPIVTAGMSLAGVRLIELPWISESLVDSTHTSQTPNGDSDDMSVNRSTIPLPIANSPSEISPNGPGTFTTFRTSEPVVLPLSNSPNETATIPTWVWFIVGAWGLGTAFYLLQFLRCAVAVACLQRRLSIIDNLQLPEGVLAGNGKFTPVIAEANVSVPMAVGIWNPKIVLPLGLRSCLETEQLNDVLVHELAHIQRSDNLVLILEAFVRIIYWPILTVHVMLRDLSVTREDACDNQVLRMRDRIDYAETLVQLAELCTVRSGMSLSAEVFGPRDNLQHRVARIVDPRRNLSPRSLPMIVGIVAVTLVGVALPLCGLAFTTEQSEPISPASNNDEQELERIVRGIEKTAQLIKTMSVTTDYIKKQLALLPVEEPVTMSLTTTAIIGRWGRVLNDTEGEQVNIEPDGKSVRIYKGRWQCVFQNGEGRRLEWYEGHPSSASMGVNLSWHGTDPREFTTQYHSKKVADIIRSRGARIIERVEWDRRPVVVVETTAIGDEQKRCYRFWIDPERNVVVRRAIFVRYKDDQPWQEYSRIECHDYQEIDTGIWLPMNVKYESVDVTPELTPEKLSWSFEGKNRDWHVNQELPAETFELPFPDGVRVNDHRSPSQKAVSQLFNRLKNERRSPFGGLRHRMNDAGEFVALTFREYSLQHGDMAAIGTLPYLETLSLAYTIATDADVAELKPLRRLVNLNLWKTDITNSSAVVLSELTTLRTLRLGETRLTDESLALLAKLPNLRHLDLARCPITDTGLKFLKDLKHLESLKLAECKITDAGIEELIHLPHLRSVTLDETQVTPEGLARLAQLDHLHWMSSDDQVANELARRVSSGDTEGAEGMLSIGLELPIVGTFKTRSVAAITRTDRDIERQRQRYRIEWDWNNGRPEVLFAEVSIRQRSAKLIESGVIDTK